MGALRFVLAVIVVLSHTGVGVGSYNPGVVAVVSFLLISGFVMTKLISRNYPSIDLIPLFYMDRAARLFPQFLFYCFVAIALLAICKTNDPSVSDCSPSKVLANLLIVPLDFYQFPASNVQGCMLLPPTWSLGLEVTFYLIVPFVILLPRAAPLIAIGSITLFLVAAFDLVNNDLYAYRLLPGVMFVFLAGMSLASEKIVATYYPLAVWAGAAALITLHLIEPTFLVGPGREVLIGLVLGIPLLATLSRKNPSSLDSVLGNLSYGIFLNHFIFIRIFNGLLGPGASKVVLICSVLSLSIAASALTFYLIEERACRWRRSLRRPNTHNWALNMSGESVQALGSQLPAEAGARALSSHQ